MTKPKTCLVSTCHDPEGSLLNLTINHFLSIRSLYDYVVIELSGQTWIGLIHYFSDWGYVAPCDHLGNVRRRVLQHALDKTDADLFHFIDFDRLLFWQLMHPAELCQTIESVNPERFTVIGRTKAAFDSHPWLQRETEAIANRIFSQQFGREMDILAASRFIPRAIADRIVKRSIELNPACIDAEWVEIASGIDYREVNGMAYESNLLGIQKPEKQEVTVRMSNLVSLANRMYP